MKSSSMFLCRRILRRYYSKIVNDAQNENPSLPLSNIRVLDLTRIIAGPFCTMLLADLGAEVIKLEQPGTGDEARRWGPPFLHNTEMSTYFTSINRNKKSICVNLKDPAGQQLVKDLVNQCDVLVENFVPGKMDKLNLGYNHLSEINPQLIYCSITGFGPKGPYRNRPGYDIIAASIGGLLHITGNPDGPPCKVGIASTDISTGLYAHGAIMAALLHRFRTGKGQKIDCNLLSTQISMLINVGANYLNAGIEGQRWGTSHANVVPHQVFKTKNGYITIGTGSDKQYQDMCKVMNIQHLTLDPRYLTGPLRVANRETLCEEIETKTMEKTTEEWLLIFQGVSFPYAQVNNISQVFADEHVKDVGLVKEISHEKYGNVKIVGPAVQYSLTQPEVRTPPPTLGQDTDYVLQDILNYDEGTIEKLKGNKIV
uniref:Succinate--hydroxymethylglutarate CoA-transferase n=1 Tax=Cacopsylla melanoneura TaxID=428564 RepID=A0A8D8S9C5_9HEMI